MAFYNFLFYTTIPNKNEALNYFHNKNYWLSEIRKIEI